MSDSVNGTRNPRSPDSPSNHAAWQFWIDVGGTFTDCIATAADGSNRRHKILSSGVTKGVCGNESTTHTIADPARSRDPDSLWRGYHLRLIDAAGHPSSSAGVLQSRGHLLQLKAPLPRPPVAGQTYELFCEQEAPLVAIRQTLGLSATASLPPLSIRLGTTRGTNALLTRSGARTALVTTRGFGDVLRIGYQDRPDLFELNIHKPTPLFCEVVEVDARMAFDGRVLSALDHGPTRTALERLKATGVQSLAICLLNAYADPRDELELAQLAQNVGFHEISLSHQVASLVKLVARGDTTVLDAYLNPLLREYVSAIQSGIVQPAGEQNELPQLRIMTSAGGLVAADQFRGRDSVLSGPAGGVVGFARVAEAAGFHRAIGLDMGGTSTDVARYDGQFDLEFETQKAGVRIVAPMMAIETVAAGGGSICRFDGFKLVVGPESAGADPGPACYGRGGPLTVTDLNLFLGRLLNEQFPFPLDERAVAARLEKLAQEVAEATGRSVSNVELADGLLRIANLNMASAVRSISVAKGYDPQEYLLVGFGGAAPQHACAIARELGIRQVLNHPDGGVLSALGIGAADMSRHAVQGLYCAYDAQAVRDLEPTFADMQRRLTDELLQVGITADQLIVRRALDLRYVGLDDCLTIQQTDVPSDGEGYSESYHQQHRRLHGYDQPTRAIEIVAARMEVIGRTSSPLAKARRCPPTRQRAERTVTTQFQGQSLTTSVFVRERLAGGARMVGPAILLERFSTTVIDPGWEGELLSDGQLLLTDVEGPNRTEKFKLQSVGELAPDPIQLEIFYHAFEEIAQQMGIALRKTSTSVNVKERLDFSCALFTANGDLVVNAPHIPVHLGAMGETVRGILEDCQPLERGDVIVTNDPYRGGSHLPDITVVTPVFNAMGELLLLTASRAHHAEIGGIVPGSMPPAATNLAEEGVLIRSMKLVVAGTPRFDRLELLLGKGPYPSRQIAQNLADVRAQIAANQQGTRRFLELIERHGEAVVLAYMQHIQSAAEQKMRQAIAALPDGSYSFHDYLDDGTAIAVTTTVAGNTAIVDFSGTANVHPGNLNANRAITTAALIYCLRCLVAEQIPLNQGLLRPVKLIIPEGLLSPRAHSDPRRCPAVAGGNVETSQRIVDVLLGSFGNVAASQGTMNNLLFGDTSFGYYETICGGAGATSTGRGADAVHTHMTNTRLTDPEVMERLYPVRVNQFAIRRGSGGLGLHRGGDGVVRDLQFLAPLSVSLLTQRRGPYAPYGAQGGHPGALGRNSLQRADGQLQVLPGQCQFEVQAGDVLRIETPGGGGFGKAPRKSAASA